MSKRFAVETVFKGVDRMSGTMRSMTGGVRRYSSRMTRSLNRVNHAVRGIGRGLRRASFLGVASTATLVAGMHDVVNAGADFEHTMVAATAKFPENIVKGTKAFNDLAAVAKRIGETTEFSARQAAEGFNFFAMASFNAAATVANLPITVDLATVAQVDLARATDIATDSLGAFGLLSKDTATQAANLERVVGQLSATSLRSNTNVEQLFEAVKDGAPIAAMAKVPMEEFMAMTGTLANAGIKGTRAGTAMKRVLLGLIAPSSEAAKIFRRLRVELKDPISGNPRSPLDIFMSMRESMNRSNLDLNQQIQLMDRLFGKIPIASALNLLNMPTGEIKKLRDEIKAAGGDFTKVLAKRMRDTTRGSINELLSIIDTMRIEIFDESNESIRKIVVRMHEWVGANKELIAQKVGEWVKYVDENSQSLLDSTAKWTKWGTTVIGAIVGFKLLVGFINGVQTMAAIGVFTALGGAITLLIGSFAFLGYQIYKNMETITALLKEPVETLKAIWGGLPEWMDENVWKVMLASPLLGSLVALKQWLEGSAAPGGFVERVDRKLKGAGVDVWRDFVPTAAKPVPAGPFTTPSAAELSGPPTTTFTPSSGDFGFMNAPRSQVDVVVKPEGGVAAEASSESPGVSVSVERTGFGPERPSWLK